MSDSKEKSEKSEKPAPKGPSKGTMILGIVLPALFAGGAAFGGARAAGGAAAKVVHVEAPAVIKPPGPTLALEPFLVTLTDGAGKPHAMKVVLAIEFSNTTKEEVLKPIMPRVRDAALTYLRAVTYDTAADRSKVDGMRNEMLESIKKSGAVSAERILITDFVLQ